MSQRPTNDLVDVGTRGNGGRILWWKTNAGAVGDSLNAWEPGQLMQVPKENGDGMLMNTKAIRVSDVTDGTSNTLFVGEVTAGTGHGHGEGHPHRKRLLLGPNSSPSAPIGGSTGRARSRAVARSPGPATTAFPAFTREAAIS